MNPTRNLLVPHRTRGVATPRSAIPCQLERNPADVRREASAVTNRQNKRSLKVDNGNHRKPNRTSNRPAHCTVPVGNGARRSDWNWQRSVISQHAKTALRPQAREKMAREKAAVNAPIAHIRCAHSCTPKCMRASLRALSGECRWDSQVPQEKRSILLCA